MTAAAAPAGPVRPASEVPWRRLTRATVRQHRTALMWAGIVVVFMALLLLGTGIAVRQLEASSGGFRWYGQTRASVDWGGWVIQDLTLLLQLLPLLAGVFIGAPLLPREIEHGTTRLAWTQSASRPRWLLAQVLPVAGLLALAGLGLGGLFDWWQAPFPAYNAVDSGAWAPLIFNLSPVLLAGWAVFAFTLGVLVGAAIRRTVAAMAVTLLGYGVLLHEVAYSWRMHYLTPLRRSFAVTFSDPHSQGIQTSWGGYWGSVRPVDLGQPALGYRDGRLLGFPPWGQSLAWLRSQHLVMWEVYQPASRYDTFQLIELGWLLVAAALLITAAVILVRRRPA